MNISDGTVVFDGDGTEYRVVEYIGKGGCGIVYRVENNQGESLAFKTIEAPFINTDDVEILINEGNQALQIRSPHVIKYKFFHDGRTYPQLPVYILMEYADGGNLRDLIASAAPAANFLNNDELESMFNDLLTGMTAIGETLVHRDLKPENILIQDGSVKISDFGLAKVAQETTRQVTFKGWGTDAYMAPEAWSGEKNTISMDIYSLGMIFYELATLRHPFDIERGNLQEWRNAHMFSPVPSPKRFNAHLSDRLSQIVLKFIEKRVEDRPKNWQEARSLFGSLVEPSKHSNPILQKMLEKRMRDDEEASAAALAEEKRLSEKREFEQRVVYQIESEICTPLREFFGQFNSSYGGNGFSMSSRGGGDNQVLYRITSPSGAALKIDLAVAHPDNFWTVEQFDDWGQARQRRVQRIPHINKRPIEAWGYIEAIGGRGLNLILLKNPVEGEIYGEWVILRNTAGMFARTEVKEPFAFDYAALPEAISMIGVMHTYQVRVEPYRPEVIHEFIAEYV